MKTINGWHVFGMFALGFGIIIAVNMTLAINAVRTFPGVEVKNSYVASQQFDANRAAQEGLAWDVAAMLDGNILSLEIVKDGAGVSPVIESAVFGRATSTAADQTPNFVFDGHKFTAEVEAGSGNWNLRVAARAENGALFQQRIIVEVIK
ncbi:MAG: FixH family protein [Pseudomonadota bacterium]